MANVSGLYDFSGAVEVFEEKQTLIKKWKDLQKTVAMGSLFPFDILNVWKN